MPRPTRRDVVLGGLGGLVACSGAPQTPPAPPPSAPPDPLASTPNGREPQNVLVVLVDDQRWDMLGFLGHPFLKTPGLDRLAAEGTHFANAFVTTSLCCPSRATLLTGLYAHAHGVLDNKDELDPSLPTWNRIAQQAGVDTALFGKWHMGAPNPHPRPGWSRWVAFGGQGSYEPTPTSKWSFDGELRAVEGYTTDRITDLADEWLRAPERRSTPWAAVVSHKAVHAPFVPPERHRDIFADVPIPETLPDTDAAYEHLPAWLRHMRHETEFGVEQPYRKWPDFASWYRDYHRVLLAVDEGVQRLLATLEQTGQLERTTVIYTSDNGFMVGEKGVLDKRNAYESSMRIPLIVRRGGGPRGQTRTEPALNVDTAPTILDALGLSTSIEQHGASLLSLEQPGAAWRKEFVYEYFHERTFPSTPTLFAIRTDRMKLIVPFGTIDRDELYDLVTDPQERSSVIDDPAYADRARALRTRMGKKLRTLGLIDPVWGRQRALASGVAGEDGEQHDEDGPAEQE
ncbi:MAG: sulfatase [Myxococcales bacterium]|nr:sulfatase [Myxococcales bacterium]